MTTNDEEPFFRDILEIPFVDDILNNNTLLTNDDFEIRERKNRNTESLYPLEGKKKLNILKPTKKDNFIILLIFISVMVLLVIPFVYINSPFIDEWKNYPETEFSLDEKGLLVLELVPHLCHLDSRYPLLRLKPSIHHDELLFLSHAHLQEEKCIKDDTLTFKLLHNSHFSFEIYQKKWYINNEEEEKIIFNFENQEFDGYFPLGDQSFIWEDFFHVKILRHSLIFINRNIFNINDDDHDDHIEKIIENRQTIELDETMWNDRFTSHIDTLFFICYSFIYVFWSITNYNGIYMNRCFSKCGYILSLLVFVYNAMRINFYEDKKLALISLIPNYIIVMYGFWVITFLFVCMFKIEKYFLAFSQLTFWMIPFIINLKLEIFVTINLIVSLIFLIHALTRLILYRKKTFNINQKEDEIHYILCVIITFLQSFFLNFIPWMGYHHLKNPPVINSLYYFSSTYFCISPMLVFILVIHMK